MKRVLGTLAIGAMLLTQPGCAILGRMLAVSAGKTVYEKVKDDKQERDKQEQDKQEQAQQEQDKQERAKQE